MPAFGLLKLSPAICYIDDLHPASPCSRSGSPAKGPAYPKVLITVHFLGDQLRASVLTILKAIGQHTFDEGGAKCLSMFVSERRPVTPSHLVLYLD
jgi:hypothetical protein